MGATFLEVLVAMLVANGLTACILYGAWRTRRNESDITGLMFVIVPCLLGAVTAFAVL